MTADHKIVIVMRKTRYEELTERFSTRGQAHFYVKAARASVEMARGRSIDEVEKLGEADFAEYDHENGVYQRALDKIRSELDFGFPIQVIDRAFLPNYLFGPMDVVVTVGQDGLVANTAKYALNLPIVAINPDPARFDGVLLPFQSHEARTAVARVLEKRATTVSVTLAEALLNDGQRLLAFNDLYIGSQSHVSARYRIQVGGETEAHSSSGVLVSTGAGSTGWLSSMFNMASGLVRMTGRPGNQDCVPIRLAWDEQRLVYVVREPFVSRVS